MEAFNESAAMRFLGWLGKVAPETLKTWRESWERWEKVEHQHPEDVWACPICRNWYALSDGARVCTHDRTHTCKCPDMPLKLRRIRDLDLLRRAVVLSDPAGRAEKLEALERIEGGLQYER